MKELIVKCQDGTLVSATDGRRWMVNKSMSVEGSWVVGLVFPPTDIDQQNAVAVVLSTSENKAECEAILESLGKRLGAVKWSADLRTFVSVSGGSDG